jgi:hypothetical protein
VGRAPLPLSLMGGGPGHAVRGTRSAVGGWLGMRGPRSAAEVLAPSARSVEEAMAA